MGYLDFLNTKRVNVQKSGFEVKDDDLNPILFDFQKYCPLQLDTIKRAVTLWSNEGDTVLTPFLGIGSEVYQSILMGRKGIGFELKDSYFTEAVKNCKKAEFESGQKTLFNAM